MRYYVAIIVFLVLAVSACTKNNLSKIPQISSLSITPREIKAGASQDTVFISFHFRDGDADIGNDPNTTNYDIFVIDSRNITDTLGFFFPTIDNAIKNPSNGLEGDCTIKLLGAYINVDTTKAVDTMHFMVYMQDQAMNHSNVQNTPDIYIKL